MKTMILSAAITASALALGAGSALAQSCPDWRYDAPEQIYGNAYDFYTPHSYHVVAGGGTAVDYCPVANQTPERATGYVADRPDFEVYYDGNSAYDLEIRVVGNCDTTLLINTANGNWFFDDDDLDPTYGDARIYLTNPSEGWYDIWVGTYNNELCDAELTIETF